MWHSWIRFFASFCRWLPPFVKAAKLPIPRTHNTFANLNQTQTACKPDLNKAVLSCCIGDRKNLYRAIPPTHLLIGSEGQHNRLPGETPLAWQSRKHQAISTMRLVDIACFYWLYFLNQSVISSKESWDWAQAIVNRTISLFSTIKRQPFNFKNRAVAAIAVRLFPSTNWCF